MEKFLSVLFLCVGISAWVLLLRQLYLKGVMHFKLLKALHPEKVAGVSSFLKLILPHNFLRLDSDITLWIGVPFYYSKYRKEDLDKDALEIHKRLIRYNKLIVLYLLIFVSNIALVGTTAYLLK